jgi:uncharacterized protein HemX
MDDQNKANNQFGEQPKKEQPADTSSAAPVEVEPATDTSAMPTPTPAPTTATPPVNPVSSAPVPPTDQPQPVTMPTPLEEEKKLEMPPQPELLEAPKKKNGMFIAVIAIVLVIALAFLGWVVYKAMY